MPALSDHTNVFNTALRVLKQKVYRVWRAPDRRSYHAEKNGWDFMADGPVGLLGVVAIFEHEKPREYREYWWKHDVDLDETLPTRPPRYRSVVDATARKRLAAARKVRAARSQVSRAASARSPSSKRR